MLADYFSMKNWGSSSFSDYSELHRDCFVACYSYPRTKPTPWWVQMGSRLGIQNFDVNHCNTHKLTKDMLGNFKKREKNNFALPTYHTSLYFLLNANAF